MSFVQAFSTKRQAIKKASTVIMIAMTIAAVVLSLSLVGLKFMWSINTHNSKVIAKKELARDTLKDNVDKIDDLIANFEQLEQGKINSQTILDALPSKYDFPALATSVEALASRSGLVLKSYAGDDNEATAINSEVNPVPIEMPVNITVEGSYESLVRFINNLDKSIRPMQVNQITIKGTDQTLKVDMQLSSYYQPAVSVDIQTEVIND